MATTEGNTVRGGKIAYCITSGFKKNYEYNNNLEKQLVNWQKFGEITKQAKKMIEEHTDQAMVVNEHDYDIDDVVFLHQNYDRLLGSAASPFSIS